MSNDSQSDAGTGEVSLARAIGPTMLVFLIMGDMLGAGIYTLVGRLSKHVGGMVWLPLAVGFVVAALTAASYAELVGKYPRAAGAALYAHRAFRSPFFTFIVAFAVLMSGISSASAASLAFGSTYLAQFVDTPVLLAAFVFLGAIAIVNFIGISESIKINFVLTVIELSGLVIVMIVGVIGIAGGEGDSSRAMTMNAPDGAFIGILGATALGFYALIGFEDSVNLAEECKSPARTFPRALFIGIGVTGLVYIAIAIIAMTLVDPAKLAASNGPLLLVVEAAGVHFPPKLFAAIALLAICNTALMNMIMASRLLYGMANEQILPKQFARVHATRRTPYVAIAFTVAIAAILILSSLLIKDGVKDLANTTVLLLLVVFAIVNIAVLVLRQRPVDHPHFQTPTWAPALGAATSLVLASPLAGTPGRVYFIALCLVGVGVALWFVNQAITGKRVTEIDAENLVK